MEKLSGGFVNDCIKRGTAVVKEYQNDGMCAQAGTTRRIREQIALGRFGNGHGLAPELLAVPNDRTLIQEYLDGSVMEGIEKDEYDFHQVGKLLSGIHTPVKRSFTDTKNYYENRYKKHVHQAQFILNEEGITVPAEIDVSGAENRGTTRIHRDFWLGNVIRTREAEYKAIDWEFSGIGSPYEDFAIADMWIFREYGRPLAFEFYQGYGREPDQQVVNTFLMAKAVEFIARCSFMDYETEPRDGFYHNKISVLKELL